MKLSFSTFACPNWSVEQIVAAAMQYGYQGVEFRCDADHEHAVEIWAAEDERRNLVTRFGDYGLEISCLATSLQCTSETLFEDALPRVQLASDIGAAGIRVFFGRKMPFISEREMYDRAAAQLKQVCDTAENEGLEVWLHLHDMLSYGAVAAAFIQMVGSPGLGVVYDNLHPYRKGEPPDATMAAVGTMIRHVHFRDGMNRHDQVVITRLGEGEMPVDYLFESLINTGFNGHICGEWYYNQYGETPDESLENYRNDMAQLAESHDVQFML